MALPQEIPPLAPLERVLRRDRSIVGAALVALTVPSWLYLVRMASSTVSIRGSTGAMHQVMSCCGVDLPATILMWIVMMVGMMVPSSAPMILMFATMNRRRAERGGPYVPTGIFVAGYLLAWTGFSVLAASLQWGLFHVALLDPHRQAVAPWLAGMLLIGCGVFQLTPAKNACLSRCRSPLGFLTNYWAEGYKGALKMGLIHGLFCLGCCWLLMALLFVAGVMNLIWVAVITAFVLAEKLLPWGRLVVWIGAATCVAWGFAVLGRAFLAV